MNLHKIYKVAIVNVYLRHLTIYLLDMIDRNFYFSYFKKNNFLIFKQNKKLT